MELQTFLIIGHLIATIILVGMSLEFSLQAKRGLIEEGYKSWTAEIFAFGYFFGQCVLVYFGMELVAKTIGYVLGV